MKTKFLNTIYRYFGYEEKPLRYNSLYLPNFRTNEALSNNVSYINSAIDQINFLMKNCKLDINSRMLDFGCGQGRILNGLEYSKKPIKEYIGIDTDIKSIQWCNRWLKNYTQKSRFICVSAFNQRYNKNADGLLQTPIDNNYIDLIFLNSVFSHMLTADIKFYLKEFNRILKKDGFIYLTAFIEDNVPKVSENPEGYIDKSSGRLHRVRYNKEFFHKLCAESGFNIEMFLHQGIERTKQSVVILKKN